MICIKKVKDVPRDRDRSRYTNRVTNMNHYYNKIIDPYITLRKIEVYRASIENEVYQSALATKKGSS